MAKQSLAHPFVLGFVGDEVVHPANAKALLKDLIAAYLRQNKGAQVRFVLLADPYTDTMDELANFGYSSGYQLDFICHHEEEIPDQWQGHVDLIAVSEEISLWLGLVNRLSNEPAARLILVADPNIDDIAYGAAFTAANRNVKVRSLLAGLDIVLFTQPPPPEEEEETERNEMARDEDYEDEYETDDEAEVDEDEEYDVDDEADEEEEEEEEAVVAEVEVDVEDDEDFEDEDEPEAEDEPEVEEEPEEEPEEEEVQEPVAARRPTKKAARTTKRATKRSVKKKVAATTKRPVEKTPSLTRARLERMAETDRDEFMRTARSYGVTPGRGIKISTMVTRVIDAVESGRQPRKVAATKAPAARRPVAAKKATKTVAATNSSSNVIQSRALTAAELKKALSVAEEFIHMVKASVS